MSRVRALFTTSTFIAGVIWLSATLLPDIALAQCSKADLCSAQKCRQLHTSMEQACKKQKRSCTKVSVNDKRTLAVYLQRNEQCLTAREAVDECFSTTDPGHEDAIESVVRAIEICQTKLDD